MQRSNVDSWFFGCLGAVFLILAALATPEVARADGGECEPDPITYCNNKCGVDGQCYKDCIDACEAAAAQCYDAALCNFFCSSRKQNIEGCGDTKVYCFQTKGKCDTCKCKNYGENDCRCQE